MWQVSSIIKIIFVCIHTCSIPFDKNKIFAIHSPSCCVLLVLLTPSKRVLLAATLSDTPSDPLDPSLAAVGLGGADSADEADTPPPLPPSRLPKLGISLSINEAGGVALDLAFAFAFAFGVVVAVAPEVVFFSPPFLELLTPPNTVPMELLFLTTAGEEEVVVALSRADEGVVSLAICWGGF